MLCGEKPTHLSIHPNHPHPQQCSSTAVPGTTGQQHYSCILLIIRPLIHRRSDGSCCGTTTATPCPNGSCGTTIVVFVRNSIYKPSHGSDGIRLSSRCYFVSCRSRRKPALWSPIKAAPALACDKYLGVVDRSTSTVMGRLAGLLPSRTPPPRSSATIAIAQLSLTCRVRVRQSSASAKIASMS